MICKLIELHFDGNFLTPMFIGQTRIPRQRKKTILLDKTLKDSRSNNSITNESSRSLFSWEKKTKSGT